MPKRAEKRLVVRRSVAAAVAMLLLGAVVPAAAGEHHHDHGSGEGGGRIGVLIADHGEPPEYNEFTYWSFRKFFNHLIEMGLIPPSLKTVDNGTIHVDRDCYDCDVRPDPVLMDAWLKPHEGPGTYVPRSDNFPAHYVMPGGPGQGEPDIFEYVGVMAWHEWQLMGGRSPNYDQKLPKKVEVIRRLNERYPDIPVAVGYGIDPRIGGSHQGIPEAVVKLVNKDRVDTIVVAYHGAGFSDIMQTHMLRHEIEDLVEQLDPDVKVAYTRSMGTTDAYVRGVVREAKRELARVPAGAPVALHLSEHGLPLTQCGDYDCGSDSYHEFARRLFARAKATIDQAVDRRGKFGIFQLYGSSGEGDDDPDDEVDSPMEALAKRKNDGFRYVIDIPYSFDSDSRDTLIILRHGYHRPIPDWNGSYESRFTYEGMKVKIGNSQFGDVFKTRALEKVIVQRIEQLL